MGPTGRCGVARCWSLTSRGFERVARLRAAPMPGGVAAIREPWRMAAVWAARAGLDPGRVLPPIDVATLDAVLALAERSDAVTTTSAGRLFDAVAVLLGGRTHVTYEAQAAIELEALARSAPRSARADLRSRRPAATEVPSSTPRRMIAALARDVAARGRPSLARRWVPRVVRPARRSRSQRERRATTTSTRSC